MFFSGVNLHLKGIPRIGDALLLRVPEVTYISIRHDRRDSKTVHHYQDKGTRKRFARIQDVDREPTDLQLDHHAINLALPKTKTDHRNPRIPTQRQMILTQIVQTRGSHLSEIDGPGKYQQTPRKSLWKRGRKRA